MGEKYVPEEARGRKKPEGPRLRRHEFRGRGRRGLAERGVANRAQKGESEAKTEAAKFQIGQRVEDQFSHEFLTYNGETADGMIKLIKEDGTKFEIEKDFIGDLIAAEPDDFELDDGEVVPDMGGLKAPESARKERPSLTSVEKKPRSEASDQAVIKEQLARISEFIDAGNKFKGLIANEARKLIDAWNRVDSTDYFGDQRQLKEAVRQATETIEAQIAKLGNVSPEVLDIFEEDSDLGGLKEPEAKIDDEVIMAEVGPKVIKSTAAEKQFFKGAPALGDIKVNEAAPLDNKFKMKGLLEDLKARYGITMDADGQMGFWSRRKYNKLHSKGDPGFDALMDEVVKLQVAIAAEIPSVARAPMDRYRQDTAKNIANTGKGTMSGSA